MTIQPQPSKVIFEIVEVEGFYRIRKSEFYSGDEGNPPLIKILNLKTKHTNYIRAAAARCARGKMYEGYKVLYHKQKWICELDLSNGD